MAGITDIDTAEIDGKDIERGVGGALEDATEPSDEGVGTILCHRVDHHAARPTARERFHECRWQCLHEVGIAPYGLDDPFHPSHEHIHGSSRTEHADAHEDSHEIGDNAHRRGETVFCPFNEGIVDVDAPQDTCHDESHDNRHQQRVGHRGAHDVHLLLVHAAESPDDGRHEEAESAEGEQQRTVEEVDALEERGHHQSGDGGEKRSQEDRDEHVGGLCGPHLCPIDKYAHGDDGEARRIEHQKHDHRVGGGILLRIEFLHLLHGFQSHWGGGIVETEHIGGDIHEDGASDGMALGNIGKEPAEHRTEQLGESGHHTTLFTYFHDAHPQGEHTRESDGDFEGCLRRLEGGIHHSGEHFNIAHEDEPYHGDEERDEEKTYPDIVEYHTRFI